MHPAKVKLIVTGDDFGYCPRRNRGIVDCFLAGAVSNVSLLVNGQAASDAALLARRHDIPIGLHANLSEGSPVCEALQRKSSLLNEDGFFHGKMGIRKALAEGRLEMSEIKQELCAQVNLFRQLTGRLPDHMDGHQHIHVLPEIRYVFAKVLEEHGIRYTRVPIEQGLHGCRWIPEALMDFYLGVEKDSLSTVEVFRRHGLRWPDLYIGLTTMGKNMSVSHIQCAIDASIAARSANGPAGISNTDPHGNLYPSHNQPNGTVAIELMVHPGYPSVPPEGGCGEGPDDFSQSWERQHELQTLTDPQLLSYYKERNVQLCAFKDL
ncbi:carbohydrate deacetylase [Ambystoma mexicanum]|uniref:carbohydrate deacetylase n=1 Tax=Ambystoma mexicanum TaxID=8296 RepID=UPI0037E7A83D